MSEMSPVVAASSALGCVARSAFEDAGEGRRRCGSICRDLVPLALSGGRLGWDTIRRRAGLALLAVASLASAAAQECAVSGRVTDRRGVPRKSATVTAERTGALGLGQGAPAGGASTNARGEFCLKGLAPGEYFIRVFSRSHTPSASPACEECCAASSEFVPSYHQGLKGRPASVRVEKGRTVSRVAVAMRRAPAYCVRGEVRDEAGALRGDVGLSVEADGWSASVMNESGRFLLTSLPAGEYLLVVAERSQFGRVLARELIRVGPQVRPVVVRVQ